MKLSVFGDYGELAVVGWTRTRFRIRLKIFIKHLWRMSELNLAPYEKTANELKHK